MESYNFWKDKEFLVSITTVSGKWREKLAEINHLGLNKVAVFLTGLDKNENNKLFSEITKSTIKEIPFVHLKSTTTLKEIDFLIEKFNLKKANIHTAREFPFILDYSKYKNMIYIENTGPQLDQKEIKKYAGICLDFSHLEGDKTLKPLKYKANCRLIQKFNVGCNHVSAFKFPPKKTLNYLKSSHYFTDLSQFDYLSHFPESYFSDTIAMEVENTIEEQLKARDYIIKLLKNKFS
jgi:hypothetical protein